MICLFLSVLETRRLLLMLKVQFCYANRVCSYFILRVRLVRVRNEGRSKSFRQSGVDNAGTMDVVCYFFRVGESL